MHISSPDGTPQKYVGKAGSVKKVVMNEEYFFESVSQPFAKQAKEALTVMTFASNLVNDQEILALMAYVKSHSK